MCTQLRFNFFFDKLVDLSFYVSVDWDPLASGLWGGLQHTLFHQILDYLVLQDVLQEGYELDLALLCSPDLQLCARLGSP
jgi:hypothetical protein